MFVTNLVVGSNNCSFEREKRTMTTYSYHTFPGQTIIRNTDGSGFTTNQLMHELAINGDGLIVLDERADRTDQFLLGLEGRDCSECSPDFS